MEENKENTNVTNEQQGRTTYQAVKEISTKKQKGNFSIGKQVILPFTSGVLGTAIVIATCFGVPTIREKIVGTRENNLSNTTGGTTNTTTINPKQISLVEYSETGIGVAQKVRPSIVGITVEYAVNSPFYSSNSTGKAQGSGIIMSEDGYILTNNHIVNSSSTSSYYELGKASKITIHVYNDNAEYEAKIIGTDQQTDLAVLKIEKTGLTPAKIGDSDSVQVGEWVMAVGNPLGLESSVSAGIVSGINREITTSDGSKYVVTQTDAAINSGNSGGALVNSNGEVIGINTLKLMGTGVEGMGFAIPINNTKEIYNQLKDYSKVKRPYIGIAGIDLDEKTAKANQLVVGIYVKSVDDFSAAEKAGIKAGDVIIEAEGQSIKTMDELNAIKNKHTIGDTITIKVNRNGTEKELSITLQEQN